MSGNRRTGAKPDRDPATGARFVVPAQAPKMPPGLYLVATPIGNLADISLRALHILAAADIVYCEDKRHSRHLLAHYGIATRLDAYHEHNAQRVRPQILARLSKGETVALISDAGTPLVSDPGYKLVRDSISQGSDVFPVPGASALLAALTASGLPSDRFFFEGFLPPKEAARKAQLQALAAVEATLIFYEAPSRLAASLVDMAECFEGREGAVAKELTKLHEAIWRGPLAELATRAGETTTHKGEFVIVVAPPGERTISDAMIEDRLMKALTDASLRDAVREVAAATGAPRNRVYEIGLRIAGSGAEEP